MHTKESNTIPEYLRSIKVNFTYKPTKDGKFLLGVDDHNQFVAGSGSGMKILLGNDPDKNDITVREGFTYNAVVKVIKRLPKFYIAIIDSAEAVLEKQDTPVMDGDISYDSLIKAGISKPYLVQRGRIKKHELEYSNLDSIVDFDYMGSAEFEFGALFESLKSIRESIDKYSGHYVVIRGVELQIFCKEENIKLVHRFISEAANRTREWRTKEFLNIDEYCDPFSRRARNDFWWDIDNDWMVFPYSWSEQIQDAIRYKVGG